MKRMSTDKEIQEQVARTLEVAREIRRVPADPSLPAQVRLRLRQRIEVEAGIAWFYRLRPAVVAAIILIMAVLDIFAYRRVSAVPISSTSSAQLENFAAYYALRTNADGYDLLTERQ